MSGVDGPVDGAVDAGVRHRAPMTFGQLSVWRSISGHGHSDPAAATVLREWTFPGADEGRLRQALAALEERHESLRTCYDVDALEQVVLPARSEGAAELPDADAVARVRLDPVSDYPWVYAVHRTPDGPLTVTAAVNHVAADGWATDVMEDELRAHLADGGWSTPAPQPRELAHSQQRSRDATAARLVGYWREALVDQQPHRSGGGGTGSDHLELVSHDCLAAALRTRTTHAVSMHAVTLLAFLRLLHERGGAGTPLVALMASNRHTPRWQGLVSSMNQLVPLALTPTGDTSADLRRLQAASLLAYRYSMFDVDRMEEALEGSGFNGTGVGFAHFFNYAELGEVVTPTRRGARRERTRPARSAGFPVYLRVTAADSLRLSLQLAGGQLEGGVDAAIDFMESSILQEG